MDSTYSLFFLQPSKVPVGRCWMSPILWAIFTYNTRKTLLNLCMSLLLIFYAVTIVHVYIYRSVNKSINVNYDSMCPQWNVKNNKKLKLLKEDEADKTRKKIILIFLLVIQLENWSRFPLCGLIATSPLGYLISFVSNVKGYQLHHNAINNEGN